MVQLRRFCIVGLTCYVFNIAAMAALCEVAGINYSLSFVIVFILGCILGYALNKRFTFVLRSGRDHSALLRYVLVNCVILVLGTAALHVLVEWWHVWYLAAVTLVAGVSAPVSFVVHRVITYRMAS